MIFQSFLTKICFFFFLIYGSSGYFTRILAETITNCAIQIGNTCAECNSGQRLFLQPSFQGFLVYKKNCEYSCVIAGLCSGKSYNGICYDICPAGTTEDASTCLQCSTNACSDIAELFLVPKQFTTASNAVGFNFSQSNDFAWRYPLIKIILDIKFSISETTQQLHFFSLAQNTAADHGIMTAYIDSLTLKVSLNNPTGVIVLQQALIAEQTYILVFSQDFTKMLGFVALYEVAPYSEIKMIITQASFRLDGSLLSLETNDLLLYFGEKTAGTAKNSFEGIIYESRFYNNLAYSYSEEIVNLLCESGYYYDTTCQKCHDNCRTCFGSGEKQCTSCQNSKYYYPLTHECYSVCPSGTAVNGSICDNHCLVFDEETCYSCVPAYFPFIGTRFNQYICMEETTCTSQNWRFYDNKCYEKCPLGTYPDSATSCTICNPFCSSELALIETPLYLMGESTKQFLFNTGTFQYFPFPLWKAHILINFKVTSCKAVSALLEIVTGFRILSVTVEPGDSTNYFKLIWSVYKSTELLFSFSEQFEFNSQLIVVQENDYITKASTIYVFDSSYSQLIKKTNSLSFSVNNIGDGHISFGAFNSLVSMKGIIYEARFSIYPISFTTNSFLTYLKQTESNRGCHTNCRTCYGSGQTQCTSCKQDQTLNMFNFKDNSCTSGSTYAPANQCMQLYENSCLTCPSGYQITTTNSKTCASECTDNSEYIYTDQNICVQSCPEDLILSTNECVVPSFIPSNFIEMIFYRQVFGTNTVFAVETAKMTAISSQLLKQMTMVIDLKAYNSLNNNEEVYRLSDGTTHYLRTILQHTADSSTYTLLFEVKQTSSTTTESFSSGNLKFLTEYKIVQSHSYTTKTGATYIFQKVSGQAKEILIFSKTYEFDDTLTYVISSGISFGKSTDYESFYGEISLARLYYNKYFTSDEIPVLFCTGTTYYDSVTQTCKACSLDCKTCIGSSATQCSSCIKGGAKGYLFNSEWKCYASCPSGSYKPAASSPACSNQCTGFDSTGKCLKCITGSMLIVKTTNEFPQCSTETECNNLGCKIYKSKCYQACPDGTQTQGNYCTQSGCTYPCLSCSGTQCLECADGLQVVHGNPISGAQCVSNATCTSASYSVYDFNCYQTCPAGMRSNSNVCEFCNPPCSDVIFLPAQTSFSNAGINFEQQFDLLTKVLSSPNYIKSQIYKYQQFVFQDILK